MNISKEIYKVDVPERFLRLYLDDYLTIETIKKEIKFRKDGLSFYQQAKDMLVVENNCRKAELDLFLKRIIRIRSKRIELIEQVILECEQSLEPQQPSSPQLIAKQQPELPTTELSGKIKKHFGFFQGNCPRKHKQILRYEDYEKLIGWTIYFYENQFEVPEITEPIKVVNTNKTFVQLSFKYLFKELHQNSPYPNTLFDFYKTAFIPYSDDKRRNFASVGNNDEVKKLMQMHY